MNLFKKWFHFYKKEEKNIIETSFLKSEVEIATTKFQEEFRFKDINNLEYLQREINFFLLDTATNFWSHLVNISHTSYKKLQILEAEFMIMKAQLDSKIYYDLARLKVDFQEISSYLIETNVEIKEYNERRRVIENEYNKVGEEKTVKGTLSRLNGIWFMLIMGISGLAELAMYKNVFLSQEIGLMADVAEEAKLWIDVSAYAMATGFTVMIIWLAHKLGELLRHFDSALQNEKAAYLGKFFGILLIVIVAIVATVTIRGDMHEILAKDQKVKNLKELQENAQNSFSIDEDEEDEKIKVDTNDSQEEQKLRNEINQEKGATAPMFIVINFFIVVGGIFLSYETHTSSRIYESIEEHIHKLEKRKKKLEKTRKKLIQEIANFKNKDLNKLFRAMQYKAALYDKEVLAYNTYITIFELRMQTFENNIKKFFDAKGVSYTSDDYKVLLQDTISLDKRKELQHVNDIEKYIEQYYGETEMENHIQEQLS